MVGFNKLGSRVGSSVLSACGGCFSTGGLVLNLFFFFMYFLLLIKVVNVGLNVF